MERISRFRAILLLILFITILALFALKLFDLQIIKTNGNTDNIAKYTTVTTVRAARGDILDRNGNVLVGNRASYNLVFNHYVIESYGQTNEALYSLVQKCRELNLSYNDHFPVSKTRPFEYTLNDFATSWQNHFQSFMVDRSLDSDITAPLLIEKLRGRYNIPEGWSDEDARAVIGMRYEFDLRGISKLPTYTFIQDISDENLSAILELNIPGLMVESSTVREYHTKYGAHILGYMGGMDAADWEKYEKEGYSMDAYIGQSGFEEAFEDYLHGIDGQRVDVVSKDGTIVEQFWRVDRKTGEVYTPIAGNNVETTIDLELQGIAEDSLANIMKELTDPEKNTSKDESNGLDAEGAAVIVMKVKTGEILACASYPTYNLATMNQDWAEIEADPLKPFFNRAFGANYAPGSTFKMCTLIAAMEHRSTNPKSEFFGRYLYLPGEIIRDQGVFTKYPGFSPTCLIWTSNPGVTHGELTAQRALEVSCNYFFYETGTRQGIDNSMQLRVISDVYTLFSLLCRNNRTPVVQCGDDYVNKALAFLREVAYYDVKIDQVASYVGLDRSHLYRLTQARTGKSLKEHLIQFRLDRAKELLQSTDFGIAQIASACGFNDSNHFAKLFRSRVGVSPSQYRSSRRLGESAKIFLTAQEPAQEDG